MARERRGDSGGRHLVRMDSPQSRVGRRTASSLLGYRRRALLAAGLGALMLGLQSRRGPGARCVPNRRAVYAAALIAQMVADEPMGAYIRRDLEIGMTRRLNGPACWPARCSPLAVGREGAKPCCSLRRHCRETAAFDMVRRCWLPSWRAATEPCSFAAAVCVGRLFFGVSSTRCCCSRETGRPCRAPGRLGLGALLGDPLFDISALLDDTSTPGGVISALTGYRARPSGLVVLVFLVYWALAFWWLRHAAKGAGK